DYPVRQLHESGRVRWRCDRDGRPYHRDDRRSPGAGHYRRHPRDRPGASGREDDRVYRRDLNGKPGQRDRGARPPEDSRIMTAPAVLPEKTGTAPDVILRAEQVTKV